MQRSDSGFVRNSLVFHGVLPHPGLAVGVGAGAPEMGESHFLFCQAKNIMFTMATHPEDEKFTFTLVLSSFTLVI